MSTSNNTSSTAVTKGITPVAQSGKTIVIHTSNGPIVRRVQPAAKPSIAASIVAWLKS